MNPDEPSGGRDDFRVLTRVYQQGQARDIKSVVPLHPKVEEFLDRRKDALRFEIYDGFRGPFIAYNTQHLLNRKIYYVIYTEIRNPRMGTGPSTVMIFDQLSGELLYDGEDGGE